MKNTKKITKAELIEMLENWNYGAQPASVQYVTSPTLNKEGKARFGSVTRIANMGIMLGYKYENSVNNQREREAETSDFEAFMAQPLWKGKGKRISTALATHVDKGSFYMSYKKQQTFKSFHFDMGLNFIPNDMLSPYYPVSNYSNQGTEKAVYHREISIDNIRKLKFKKVTYEIV